MKKPNFFIIGAPKCGTTSMADWLSQHPRIFMSRVKEPFYYAKDIKEKSCIDEESYLRLFESAPEQALAIGEASTYYLCSKIAVPTIEKQYLSPKYIVMLRNPIHMAPSLHEEFFFVGDEHVKDFSKAWDLSPSRKLGNAVILSNQAPVIDYQNVCLLGEQVNRLLSIVERERVLFLFLDDIKLNPRIEYLKTLSFLNVPDDGRNDFPVRNSAKQPRSIFLRNILKSLSIARALVPVPPLGTNIQKSLRSLNTFHRPRKVTDKQMEQKLKEFYTDDINLLQATLNRDLSSWLL